MYRENKGDPTGFATILSQDHYFWVSWAIIQGSVRKNRCEIAQAIEKYFLSMACSVAYPPLVLLKEEVYFFHSVRSTQKSVSFLRFNPLWACEAVPLTRYLLYSAKKKISTFFTKKFIHSLKRAYAPHAHRSLISYPTVESKLRK